MQTVDFFRARLDAMIDLRHPLAVLATRLPWSRLEAELAPIWRRDARTGVLPEEEDLFGSGGGVLAAAGVSYAGRSRLPIRLMCSLIYLKHAFNLSDEETCERWAENVVWQYFSGKDYYEPRPPCDATQIGRFRAGIGEAGMERILAATIDTAVTSKTIKPAEFERIIVDSTVQEKAMALGHAVAYPVDSRLLEIARHKIVVHAKRCGIALRQSFAKEGKALKRKAGGYAHAKQFKRLQRTVKRQRTIVGKLIREVRNRLSMGAFDAAASPTTWVALNILLERADGVA